MPILVHDLGRVDRVVVVVLLQGVLRLAVVLALGRVVAAQLVDNLSLLALRSLFIDWLIGRIS